MSGTSHRTLSKIFLKHLEMSKLKVSHIVETSVWIAIIAVFFAFSFEFDQEIEIYIFGATGWPRAVLGILLLVVLGNFFHLYKKGS